MSYVWTGVISLAVGILLGSYLHYRFGQTVYATLNQIEKIWKGK